MSITASSLLDNQQALHKLSAMLPNLASLLLVVALGYTFAQIGWQLLAPQEPVEQAAVVANQARPAAAGDRQGADDITGSHLFGKENRVTTKPTQAATPVSRLNARLRGVFAADTEEYSIAIISAGKDEEIFTIGDKIQNGVELVEIHPDHVVILRQGKYEKLVMEKDKGSSIVQATLARSTSSMSSVSSKLGDIRREIMQNPTSFGEYALPIVVKQNGKQIGYRLKPQRKGEMLAQHGLQASDIITEINGVSLDNAQNGIKALRELSSASSVNLMVKRGNSFVPINITLQ